MQYRCKDGDRLDLICQKHYGTLAGTVEVVLAANPGLAERTAPTFNAGEVITLPAVSQEPKQSASTKVSLWD